jgi:uncharacterized protein YjbJ (UPF0337 family)
MNEQTLKGKWTEIKGDIQKTWGKITGDEIEQTKGNLKSISGLIQQKYGMAKDEVSTKLNDLVGRYDDKAETKKDSVAGKANEKTDQIKQSLKN